jgi:YbbR domain-containing protein
MIKRIKNLDPNLRLKMVSVLLAMAVWYMINYFSDPAIRMTVNNVPVEILHGEAIESRGDVYTVLDSTDVIPVVTLQAKRSVIDKLEAKNIIATADVRDMEEDGSIRIVLTTDKYSNSIERITGSISHVALRVEPQKTRSLPLNVVTEGTPADGYVLYESAAEQNQVDLSGPQSYVEAVSRAEARVDITGSERSIHSYPSITLYDQEGEEISKEEMTTHKLHLNISSVKVSATIYQTREIALTCGSEVPLADGYELESKPAVEPGTITVAGAAGILRETDSINIPAEDIATDPVSANIHKQIDITKYLPEGLLTTTGEQNKVTVYIRVRRAAEESGTGGTSSDTGTTTAAAETAETAETAEE